MNLSIGIGVNQVVNGVTVIEDATPIFQTVFCDSITKMHECMSGSLWNKYGIEVTAANCIVHVTNFQQHNAALKEDPQQQQFDQYYVPSNASKDKGLVFDEQGHNLWLSSNYHSPMQSWIVRSCSSSSQHLHILDDIFHLQVPSFRFSPAATEIPAYKHSDFNVSLFCMMTKHRGRSHCTDEVLRWLHWLSNFT